MPDRAPVEPSQRRNATASRPAAPPRLPLIVRLALLAAPGRLRRAHGADLRATLADRVAEARVERGRRAAWKTILAESADLVACGLRARLRPPTPLRPPPRRESTMDTTLADLRFALRGLLRRPGFTAMVVATLALGIGANTALFSVLDAVLLRPLPYPEPERLVRVWPASSEDPASPGSFSLPDAEDWAERSDTLAALGLYSTLPSDVALSTDRGAFELATAYVTAGFFEAMAAPALLGRTLLPGDFDGDAFVAVLSQRLWTERFGADPAVVGSDLILDEQRFRVVGVVPESFAFPEPEIEVWVPLQVIPPSSIPYELRAVRFLEAVARLAPGAELEPAAEELSTVAAALAAEHPDTNASLDRARVAPLRETIVGDVRVSLLVLFAGVGTLLLIGCVNVAQLQIAQGARRRQEIEIRGALGATRGRLVRQLATESVVLALIGGAAGVGLAFVGVRAIASGTGGLLPRAAEVEVDVRVLAFALAVSLATGLLFGLAPAWRSARDASARGSAAGGAGRRATTASGAARPLIVVEVAVALVLLVGAGLMLRTLDRLYAVDAGFEPEGLLAVELTISDTLYPEREDYLAFYREAMERLAALPGVSEVGSIRRLPLRGRGEQHTYRLPDRPAPTPGAEPTAELLQVSPGALRALGVPLHEGRPLTAADRDPDAPVALVNQALAREAFGDASPVGRTLSVSGLEISVVGVVGDLRQHSLDLPPVPTLYVSQETLPRRGMTFLLRAPDRDEAGGPLALADEVRAVLATMDRAQPITEIASMEQIVSDSVARPRFLTTLLAAVASLALLLAALGVYGVVAQHTSRRVTELGVRSALGARRSALLAMVVRQGMAPVVLGALAGVAAALLVTRWMTSMLFEVAPGDPWTLAAACATLLLAGLAAAAIPAWSATRADPLRALRAD